MNDNNSKGTASRSKRNKRSTPSEGDNTGGRRMCERAMRHLWLHRHARKNTEKLFCKKVPEQARDEEREGGRGSSKVTERGRVPNWISNGKKEVDLY